MTHERRTQRSNNQQTALRYQLDTTRSRARLEAIALADATGLLVAWSGDEALCEEMAAMAPIAASRSQAAPALTTTPEGTQVAAAPPHATSLVLRRIECFGQPLYLAGLGGSSSREAVLSHSAQGIHRILTAN